ncbi:bacterial low temperature requirement A protein-domain-containing protein [Obelidium mucronatum]|nr:bacterial low temperature requirement A protein-domain-containing protein [Obelidium mucronatum]
MSLFRRKTPTSSEAAPAAANKPGSGVKFDVPAVHSPMKARDRHEQHRTATPLELLFDLCIVVGVNSIAVAFAASLSRGDNLGHVVFGYFTGTFGLWFSWLAYVWFASGFGTDDALFRLGTLGQMVGVLVIANGIPSVFNSKYYATKDFTEVIYGFIIARVFYVVLFRLRAAYQDPTHRKSNLKHAAFTLLLQVLWVSIMYFPQGTAWTIATLAVMGSLEFLLPFLAESGNEKPTPFHPHHIAERYALLTIIIFGEGILAISIATKLALKGEGLNTELIKVGLGGLVILFVLWWMYFLAPFGALLHHRPQASFIWGYTHFFIHASLVLVASSLGFAAEISGHFSSPHERRASSSSDTASTGPAQSTLESQAMILTAVGISLYLISLNLLTSFLMGFRLGYFLTKVFVSVSCLLIAIFLTGHVTVGETLLVMCVPVLIQLVLTLVGSGQNEFTDEAVVKDDSDSVLGESDDFVAAV